jgi:2-polyprenyl-3-methyl-5-hydroxy-6-metoxy-1,4-benzoquinol methylase
MDVGAGSGFFSRHLLRHTQARSSLCVDPGYQAERGDTAGGKPILHRRATGPTDCDLVLMMDVLEHVDDDVALVREYAGKVPAGAHFVVTVPAFQFLWSGHDVFLGHRRRYRLTEIESRLRLAGLDVVRGAYYFGLVFPLAMAVRLLARGTGEATTSLRRHHRFANALLWSICRLELAPFPFNRLAGLTAFVLARKS